METCKYGSGADKRKPTAVKRKGVVYRAYEYYYLVFCKLQEQSRSCLFPCSLSMQQLLMFHANCEI